MTPPSDHRVSVAECSSYRTEDVSSALENALEPLGGFGAFVSPGQNVLLKVNLLSKAEPDRAVTTHPEVVRALIHAVRSAGGEVSVGDSPGGPNTPAWVRQIHQTSGIAKVCAEENVPLLLFDDDPVRVTTHDPALFGAFTIGRAVAQADVLISVPKFKTHGFMMFTGAVKNLFGCIPGLEKATFHLKVPGRNEFAEMLVDLMRVCRPALAVMDAVVGMEGDGPAGGHPRKIGALMASADCAALDVVASAMAGFDPMEVYTNRAAANRGLVPTTADEIDVLGVPWRELAPPDFRLPASDPMSRMPSWLNDAANAHLLARPEFTGAVACTLCGTCRKVCPVGAVDLGSDGPAFDRSACIRCYCCQELCPPQAITLHVPALGRLAARMLPRKRP